MKLTQAIKNRKAEVQNMKNQIIAAKQLKELDEAQKLLNDMTMATANFKDVQNKQYDQKAKKIFGTEIKLTGPKSVQQLIKDMNELKQYVERQMKEDPSEQLQNAAKEIMKQLHKKEREDFAKEYHLLFEHKDNQEQLSKLVENEFTLKALYEKPQTSEQKNFTQTFILGAAIKPNTGGETIYVNHTNLLESQNRFLLKMIVEQIQPELNNELKSPEIYYQLGQVELDGNIDKVLTEFYHKLSKGELYSNGTSVVETYEGEGIPFKAYNPKKGKSFIENKEFEKKYHECVALVKNTDDRCLYAALFLSYALKHQQFGADKFDKHSYSRHLSVYKNDSKKNLFYYTNLVYQQINPQNENLPAQTIINRFCKIYLCKVEVIEQSAQNITNVSQDELILLYQNVENHYHVITKYETYYRVVFPKYKQYLYCMNHQEWYDKRKICPKCFEGQIKCPRCLCIHEEIKETKITCKDCKRYFNSQVCFDNHLPNCADYKQCEYCQQTYTKNHKCFKKMDYDAKFFKNGDVRKENQNFIVFDIESLFRPYKTKDDNINYIREHVPFVICFTFVRYNEDTQQYEPDETIQYDNGIAGIGNYIIGLDCCERFYDFILSKEDFNTIYAHNGSKYDNLFMLQRMLNMKDIQLEVIFSAGKLMQLSSSGQAKKLYFKDSYLILNMPLKKFNQELDLGLDMDKEIQEYDFMSEAILHSYLQNGQYLTIQELVDIEQLNRQMYKLNEKEWEEFLQKYGNEDFVTRYIKYCKQDVKITVQGLIKFTQIIKDEFDGVNVLNYLTFPSFSYNMYLSYAGNQVFENGRQDLEFNRSKAEQQMVKLVSFGKNEVNRILGTNFESIRVKDVNVRFDKIKNYNVDIVAQTSQDKLHIIEVDGVYFHGLDNQDTYEMKQRFAHHTEKSKYMEEHMAENGYSSIHHITDKQITQYLKDNNIEINVEGKESIRNRDALRGGRTEAYCHYKEVPEGYVLRGYDLSSLYPSQMLQNLPLSGSLLIKGGDVQFINQLKTYAKTITGTPEEKLRKYIIRADNEKRIGFIKCSLLPPQDLKVPVISCKIQGKLLNVLCRTCAEQQSKDVFNNKQCTHDISERCIYGYFADVELIHAFNLGYQIIEAYETLIFEKTAYNTPEFKGGDFIKKLMFKKTLYSDPKDFNEAVLDGLITGGIIDKYEIRGQNEICLYSGEQCQQIQYKPALKAVYKLSSNSIFGKTGQNIVRDKIVLDNGEIIDKIDKDQITNTYKVGNKMYTQFTPPEELQQLKQAQSNSFVAGYITALSRTVLYQLQEHIKFKYEGEVLYSDTDSVYCIIPNKYKDIDGFKLDCTFGVKNEAKIPDAKYWVALGSKAYSYTNGTKYIQTTKGVMLNDNKTLTIRDDNEPQNDRQEKRCFDIYKEIMQDYMNGISRETYVKQDLNFLINIQQTDERFKILQKKDSRKVIRYNERKRIIQPDFSTLPFGYVDKPKVEVKIEQPLSNYCAIYNERFQYCTHFEQQRTATEKDIKQCYKQYMQCTQLEAGQTYFQYLYQSDTRPLTLFFDVDQDIVIEDMLKSLTEIYGVEQIYVLKSDYKKVNKYHIYLPNVIYKNINEMKYDLQHRFKQFSEEFKIDMSVYTKNRIFRLPLQYKNEQYKKIPDVNKGQYCIFMLYKESKLSTCETYKMKNYIIQDKLDDNEEYEEDMAVKVEMEEYQTLQRSKICFNQDNEDADLFMEMYEKECADGIYTKEGSYYQRFGFICKVLKFTKNQETTQKIIQNLVNKGLFKGTFGNCNFSETIKEAAKKLQ